MHKLKLNDYVTLDEDGKIVVDQAEYEQECQRLVDKERTKASLTARANLEKDLRKSIKLELREELEKEANLTAEEKITAEREILAKERKEFDKKKIGLIFEKVGIKEDEIEILLDTMIGDDSDKNIENATKYAETRKKFNDEQRQRYKEEMQQKFPRWTDPLDDEGKTSQAALMAKKIAESNKKSAYVSLNDEE